MATLRRLGDDETMLVQSGRPVAVFRTHPGAPRVLIANSLLVLHWATADELSVFRGDRQRWQGGLHDRDRQELKHRFGFGVS